MAVAFFGLVVASTLGVILGGAASRLDKSHLFIGIRSHGRRQEATEPAVADVIGRRYSTVADAGREHLHQPSGDRPVHHGNVDDEDRQQDHRHDVIDGHGAKGTESTA